MRGYESIAAVIPFSLGFFEVIDRWEGLKDSDNETVSSALLGILRHLPDEVAGDIADIKEELDLESPLENLDQALEDIALSVAEIASVTRGFAPPEEGMKKARPAAKKAASERGARDGARQQDRHDRYDDRRSGPARGPKSGSYPKQRKFGGKSFGAGKAAHGKAPNGKSSFGKPKTQGRGR